MSNGEQCRSKRSSVLRGAAGARTRGATAATVGSAKCASRGVSQSGVTSTSASRNATTAVSVARHPSLRAAAGPRALSRWMIRASRRRACSAKVWGSREPSSAISTPAGTGRLARSDASSACRPARSSRTGITHVTSPGPGPPPAGGTGWARPASHSRRPRRRASALSAGAPPRSPASNLAASSDRRSRRIGAPPISVRPPVSQRASGSRRMPNPSGSGFSRIVNAAPLRHRRAGGATRREP